MGKAYYEDYYFRHTPFNEDALDPDNYLFVGRRGAGKSSLAHFFTFQDRLKSARCIDVDEPKVYQEVLERLARSAGLTDSIANPKIVSIWEFILWSLILEEYREHDTYIADTLELVGDKGTWCSYIKRALQLLMDRFLNDSNGSLSTDIAQDILSPRFREARRRVLKFTRCEPVIIAIDSLEKYARDDDPMMRATAALIEAASNMSTAHAIDGIHVKLFVSAEIFPHLAENEISNYSKFVQNPIYLHWRPKDLVRLVCWRINEHFRTDEKLGFHYRENVRWDSSSSVIDNVWMPLFGQTLRNGNGRTESTIGYVMRHTQLRPRQFVLFCNLMARHAHREGTFPRISGDAMISAVALQERELAKEIINSYSHIYPNIDRIIRALNGMPIQFSARELDRRAPSTASQWPQGDYSPYRFREILAELGVIGRIRDDHVAGDGTTFLEADFEYSLDDRLYIGEGDECVVHPMFFHKLRINTTSKAIVYPFPNADSFGNVGTEVI